MSLSMTCLNSSGLAWAHTVSWPGLGVSSLGGLSTPCTGTKVEEPIGRLQPIAAKVLMKILFAARVARHVSLAFCVTKWLTQCEPVMDLEKPSQDLEEARELDV